MGVYKTKCVIWFKFLSSKALDMYETVNAQKAQYYNFSPQILPTTLSPHHILPLKNYSAFSHLAEQSMRQAG